MSLCAQLFTYFSVTLNNPDENDMLLVRNPNEKYVRQCIWTHEQGKEGTPHVQMWIRLFRNNSLALVKKLYPRAHIRGIAKDLYNEHTHAYAQKDDDTTRGLHVITSSDAPHDALSVLQDVFRRIQEDPVSGYHSWFEKYDPHKLYRWCQTTMSKMVEEKPYLAKYFISPAFTALRKQYSTEIWNNLVSARIEATNMTTNNAVNPDESISQSVSIPTNALSEEEDSDATSPSPSDEEEDCSYAD